ncbi:isoleucyl-tRNA synthetase [Candidatus Photodesmus blepharus]|uniref:Isoleucine--tRNA ligase n=1 Tax=Candidatus Photodesmus blepharonis TaxID=1179155 RepID=A0A084CN65_9GAMM|nr:isoleucine--tRNA ligase [Candidatus Photodesmus blepharus]KEY91244.1 isoleucyl-tRNA synthetase [Candidatus Photodesmus blepharus]
MINTKQEAKSDFSFVETEHRILNFWKENKIFQESLEQTKNSDAYVFYDGPPFATGLPHHGHLLASTIKDIIPRYFTMKNYYVQRRFGWDCHGLPIEHEIDKELGMSAQEIVKKLGITAYNNKCRSIVQLYTKEWEKTITRIGRWVDFKNDYRTMEPWYMESVWWVFKQLWNKGLVYQGEKVVPYSTELMTVLSNFEATSNYKDIQDPAITVLFELENSDEYIATWTTTPWTLPSNLALCINKNAHYTLIFDKDTQQKLWIADARLKAMSKNKNIRTLKTCKGHDLEGAAYRPLFPYFRHLKERGAFVIISDDYVSTDTGTGIVHAAPAFGEDDYRVLKSHNIDVTVCPIDMKAKFTDEVTDFKGMFVKDANKAIIQALKKRGLLYRYDTIVHSYPFCPRSDSPIIYRTIPSWYVKVKQMRDELVENNKQINWIPKYLKDGRMKNWLINSIDWAISRNRYWGTPIPIWRNDKTGNYVCIGSREELKRYTGHKVEDLHRDHVDHLMFTLKNEPGTYKRIEEVLDCWFESGSMPYAQIHYPFKNKRSLEKRFPAQFIAEGLDQTRGWFYTLQIISNCLFKKPAFQNVIVNGIVVAENGKKMSKRLRNYTSPNQLMETHGADALRLYLINSGLVKGEEQRFSNSGSQEMVRRVLLPWLNSFKFLQSYTQIDNWKMPRNDFQPENILDQWIISRLQSLKYKVNKKMAAYQLYNVVPSLFEFLEQLSNWYIRLNRTRFWQAHINQDKVLAYQTLFTCIKEFSTLMAPFTPFLSEYIYLEMKKMSNQETQPKSVHLCRFPEKDINKTNFQLEDSVHELINIILLGRQKREQHKIKLKIPLYKLTVLHQEQEVLYRISMLEEYLKSELNVKTIQYSRNESDYIEYCAKPNFPVLGKKLGKEFKKYKSKIESLNESKLFELLKKGAIKIDDKEFTDKEICVVRKAKKGNDALSNQYISIVLNCELNDELIKEGIVREVVSLIQKTRKNKNLKIEDRIHVKYMASNPLNKWIEEQEDYIRSEVLALSFRKAELDDQALLFNIDEHHLKLFIEKVQL